MVNQRPDLPARAMLTVYAGSELGQLAYPLRQAEAA
jgi:hypothetical protein